MAVSANRLELLQIADAVAREKSIDRGIVIAAMEDAIQKAARSRYGSETDIRAEINPKTGEIKLQRLLKVSETIENSYDRRSERRARSRGLVITVRSSTRYCTVAGSVRCSPRTPQLMLHHGTGNS